MNQRSYYRNLAQLGIIKHIPCAPEEVEVFKNMKPENLPDGVYTATADYAFSTPLYVRYPDVSDADINKWMLLQNARNIKTIKSCIVFFAVLTAISLVLSIIAALL